MYKWYFYCIFLLLYNTSMTYAQCPQDVLAPNVLCLNQPLVVYLNASGTVWVPARALDGGSTDNCGIQYYTVNGQDSILLDCSAAGTVLQVVLEVFDSSANSGTCGAQIWVQDTLPPMVSCRNITTYLDSNGLATVRPDDIDFFSADNCQIANKLINGQQSLILDCDSLLTSPIYATLTLIDNYGHQNSCQSTITVLDNSPPLALCLSGTTVYVDSTGTGSIAASTLDAGSTDNCGASALMFHINGAATWNYDCSKVGQSNIVVLSIDDASGNMVHCTTPIQVLDTIKPKARCQSDTVYLATTGNGAIAATTIDNLSTDNCAISSRTFSDGSYIKNYTCADVGSHLVTLVLQDPSGNIGTCSTWIEVIDSIKPTVFCTGKTIDLTTVSYDSLQPLDVGLAYDNCLLDTMILSPNVISCQHIGPVPYTLVAYDNHGNSTTCIDTIQVIADHPTIVQPLVDSSWFCPGDTLILMGQIPNNGLIYTADWLGPLGWGLPGTTSGSVDSLVVGNTGNYYFRITNGQGCPVFDSFYVHVDSCVIAGHTQDLTRETIQVFPNPSQGQITIKATAALPKRLVLYNQLGQVIWTTVLVQKLEQQVDLSNVPQGIYLLGVETSEGTLLELIKLQN